MRTCKICGIELKKEDFKRYNGVIYCSKKCYNKNYQQYRNDWNKKNKYKFLSEFKCKECKQIFQTFKWLKPKFCSKSCHSINNGKKLPNSLFKRMSNIANKKRKGKTLEEIYGKDSPKYKRIMYTLKNKNRIDIDILKVLELYHKNMSTTDIAKTLGFSINAITRRLMENGCDTNPKKGITSGTFKKGHNFFNKKEQTSKKISKKALERWKNPMWVKKWAKAKDIKPNKPEKLLIKIIKKNNLPYKYVGDFSYTIDGRCPDFIDIKNKQVVEVFGIYWHSPILNRKVDYKRTYQGTMEFYKKNGYDCLIVWDYQLKNKLVETCTKLIEFAGNQIRLPMCSFTRKYDNQGTL